MLRFRILTVALLSVAGPSWETGTAAAESQCRLQVGWEPYPVYSFLDDDGRLKGADIDILRSLGRELDCEIAFRESPWARILVEIQAGTLDVTASASRTPDRESFAWFSDGYRMTEMALFVRRGESGAFPLGKLEDIVHSGFRLGVVAGYYFGAEFERLRDDPAFAAQLDRAADYRTNVGKLMHGRIDGVLVEDVNVFKAAAEAQGAQDRVERHPLPVPGDDLHFMFSRASVDPGLVDAINGILAEMRADGRLERILASYLN